MTNQARFVQMIIDGKLVISKKKKSVLIAELQEKGFKAFPKVTEAVKALDTQLAPEDGEESEEAGADVASDGYDYLLNVRLWYLST